MVDVAAVVLEVAGKLEAAGLRVAVDQRDVNPPCVYVAPPTVSWDRLRGATATLDLYAVVPSSGRRTALVALGPLIEQVVAVWPASVGYPTDLQPLDVTDPMPAYRLPINLDVCE